MKSGCYGFVGGVADFVARLPSAILYFKTPYVFSIIIYFVVLVGVIGYVVVKARVVKKKIKKYGRCGFLCVEEIFDCVFDGRFDY